MKAYQLLSGLLLLSFVYSQSLHAQQMVAEDFEFINQNTLLDGTTFRSNVVVGISDMNGDGLDDIIRLRQGKFLEIQLQRNHRSFVNHIYGKVSDVTQFSVAIADIDNNGINDIMLGGIGDGVKVLSAATNDLNYESVLLNNSILYTQGSNLVDINGDGFLDAFVCNDTATSRTWINDRLGNLKPAINILPLDSYSPDSLNGGNYSSIWTDFDNDNDLDLYISKCYRWPLSLNDPRLENQLFVNDGNNNFTEQAAAYGLARKEQSWTTDFQDIDNDGDLDCFIVNHHVPCMLLENDGSGHYTDITDASGVYNLLDGHLQAFLRDFDCDGYVDLLLCGQQGYEFFRNNGDRTFKRVVDSFGDYLMSTYAIGDVNHDGFPDIYSATSSADENDVLWMNHKNDNHYFAISLEMPSSNRNAIGARIEIHGPWGIQIREVRSGEGYGIMNSMTQYFGLGNATAIDKLVIRWPEPDSETEEYFNLPANQYVKAVKGECLYPDKHIKAEGELVLCKDDHVKLTAPHGVHYSWSSGETSASILVSASGLYTVTVTNQWGCQSVSYPLTVEVQPDETPSITWQGQQYDSLFACRGDLIELTASDAFGYQWSNGSNNQSIVIYNSGTYTVTTQGRCDLFTSDPVVVLMTERPEPPAVVGDTIEQPGQVFLSASGLNPHWFDADGNLIFTGNNYSPFVDSSQTYFVEDRIFENGIFCASRRVNVPAFVLLLNGAGQLTDDLFLNIYPNPATEQLIIQWEQSDIKPLQFRFLDVLGRKMEAPDRYALDAEGAISLDVSHWPSGIYWLQIQQYSRLASYRFVVE